MKPEYLFQPLVLLERIKHKLFNQKPFGDKKLKTSFGIILYLNTKDVVGKAIWTFGVYDIAISEVIYRLLDEDSIAIDGGANIGYMSCIMAMKARKGIVHAFEPNPTVASRFEYNMFNLNQFNHIKLHKLGLSNEEHKLKFMINQDNIGESKVVENHETHDIEIKGVRLDSIMNTKQTFRLLKLDIEGYEYQALIGASKLLEKGNIEHIIFEDTNAIESKAKKLLKSYNYTLFKITKTLYGVELEDINCLSRENKYEPTNYLATLNEAFIKQRLYKKGWKILHG